MPDLIRVRHKTLGTEYTTVEINPEYEQQIDKPAADSYGKALPPKHRTLSSERSQPTATKATTKAQKEATDEN